MSTITLEQQQSIASTLAGMPNLPAGIGDTENACSIAAINLALRGELTDDIPPCMSRVIGAWIIKIQDAMPAAVRNSPDWRSLLPLAAGTGRKNENHRLSIIMSWMWDIVLPALQPIADAQGAGREWRTMCAEKTAAAAAIAADAADAAAATAATAATAAARSTARADAADVTAAWATAALATAATAAATARSADADAYAAVARAAAARAAAIAADAAAIAADAAAIAAARAYAAYDAYDAYADCWAVFKPAQLLRSLVDLQHGRP